MKGRRNADQSCARVPGQIETFIFPIERRKKDVLLIASTRRGSHSCEDVRRGTSGRMLREIKLGAKFSFVH